MDNPWIIHGFSMDNPWIAKDNPWISGNPFRHQMARHSSWEDFNQTNLDEISRGTVDHQGSVWGQLGPPRIILEVFCLSVTFPEIPKSRNIEFLVFPVPVFEEIQGYRCGIDVQSVTNPWFIQTQCFYWSFHDWRLAGASLGQFVNNAMDIDGFI